MTDGHEFQTHNLREANFNSTSCHPCTYQTLGGWSEHIMLVAALSV